MDFNHWLMFASIIALASISPGPNILAVVVHTLQAGVRGALYTILGNLVALFTIALAAAVGVGAVLHSAPFLFTVMKVAGGLYLAWVGIKLIRSALAGQDPLKIEVGNDDSTSGIEFAVRAMLISYSNPKSILFLAAVFPAFLDQSQPMSAQFVSMFATIIFCVTLIHGAYAFLAVAMRSGLMNARVRTIFSGISGVSFLGFGLGFIYNAQK